ncbi:arylsulfatase I-like isoform X2 [Amblyomma americanum]
MASCFLAFLYLFPLAVTCTKAPPHIIILLADDLGWYDVSFHGSSQIPTPNLDALAADGIILNSHYVQSSCAPSRAALLTGLYPIRTGMQGIPAGYGAPWGLPLNVTILPQYLKKLGYETHLVGKENSRCLDFWFNTDPVRSENGSYSTTLFTQRAQDVIQHRDKSKPFFLLLSYQAVHGTPGPHRLEAPLENIAKFPYIKEKNRTIFAGMLDSMDQSIGQVFRTLYESRMLENAVIVFTSDNGGIPGGSHGSRSINWPLRGAKVTLWEGGTRSAAFIWSPLLARNRTVSNQLMHITDWVPTLYSLAGGHAAELDSLDGLDMWPHLNQGSRSPRVEFLYDIDQLITHARGVRYERFKLVLDDSGYYNGRYRPPPGRAPYEAVDYLLGKSMVADVLKNLYREDDLKLPNNWRRKATLRCDNKSDRFSSNQTLYLFDIESDPCELENIASSRPDVVEFMKKRLNAYEATAATPLNQRNQTTVPFVIQDGLCAPWVTEEELKHWPFTTS